MTVVAADALAVLGLVIVTVGVYGIVRLPDVYTQLHSASKAGFLGIAALLASAVVQGGGALLARAALIVALLALTTPVAAHAVARTARRRGEPMRSRGAVDESSTASTDGRR